MDEKLALLYRNWKCCCRTLLAISILALTGCSWLVRPPAADPLAERLVETFRRANTNLKQYKALAHVQIELEGEVQSAGTMALAAVLPNQMRAELLSNIGQPISSMVADGQTIYLRLYAKDRIYRFRQSKTALKHLVHIPIGVEQLQRVLIGQPGLPEDATAQTVSQTARQVEVALLSRWRETQALLQFERSDGTVQKLEVFDEEGQSLYRVSWLKWQVRGPYRLPSKLAIESRSGHRVTVRMRRFWPDVALSAETFELDVPDPHR